MSEQLEFPAGPLGPGTEDVLDLVDADPLHLRDRRLIDDAVRAVARTNGGEVDPGKVRRLLTGEHGLMVYPRVLSARYHALRAAGVIEPTGWTVSDDRAGHNAGRPARVYRWTGGPL